MIGQRTSSQPLALVSHSRCVGCNFPIEDRYLLRVEDMSYHERCLACSVCEMPLQKSCHTKNSKLYCKHDYDRLFAKKCFGCGDVINPDEFVMKTFSQQDDILFHINCFCCVVCNVRLQPGDYYIFKQGQLFCRTDYDKEIEMFYGVSQEMCFDEQISSRSDGRRGPKRPRTILTTQQRRVFKASFEMSPKPCRKIRENLAKDTGLSVRIVQVWFQNQRAKMKKIQKKSRDKICAGKEDSNDNEKCKINIKKENESPHGLSMFLNDSCSDTEQPPMDSDGGVDGSYNRNYPLIKEELNSEDGFYKNVDIPSNFNSMSGTSSDEKLEANFFSSPYVNEQHHALQQFLGVTQYAQAYGNNSLNPIDRLYSMQNSYFCTENMPIVNE